MCSSTWFLWFFLSLDCPVNTDRRGEKIRHAFEEMDDRSPRYAFNQQRVLRKGRRTEKKSISFSTVPTTGEFVINTRFFCVAFSDADSIRVRARDSPLLVCFVMQSTTEERKFGRMNSWEKNQTRAHFSPKRTTKPEHIFAPPILWEGVEDLRRYTSECEITRTTGTNTLHEKVFSLFLFWTTMMPR